nr:InlB B-repeat-containing protein [Clostridia bacterium]
MKKRILSCAVCLLVLAATLTAMILPIKAETDVGVIDLSRPASSHTTTLTAADIVEYFVGGEISSEEREYLEKHGGVSIKYDKGITTSSVICEYHEGAVTVTAREYVYETKDGVSVRWIPASAKLFDTSVPFSSAGDEYTAAFSSVTEDEDASVEIEYTLDISISATEVNRLINLAYNDIDGIRREIADGYAEYDRLKAEYDAGVILYEEYLLALLKYEADCAAYTDYLSRKKIYTEKKAEYDKYLIAKESYETALIEEEKYKTALEEYNSALAKYNEYISALDLYEKKRVEYLDYLDKIELVRYQLSVVDTFKTPMTDSRTAYSAIMGSLVTEVLENNKDFFAGSAIKVDERLIDDAALSTERLREILTAYFEKKTDEEKYQFYINNYEALRDNTILLVQSLDEIYNYDKVRAAMNAKNQTYPRKYEILVAQLVIIANGLSDSPVYSYWQTYCHTYCGEGCTRHSNTSTRQYKYELDSDTLIHKSTVSEVLEGKEYVIDTDTAQYLADGYPTEITEPTAPTEVIRPTKPTPPYVPARPDEVENPGEPPIVVDDPGAAPTEVTEPVEPEEYIPPEEWVNLLSLYDRGELSERAELGGDSLTLIARETITKKLFNVDTVTVFFYGVDGEFLYKTEVDSGTRADFVGAVPTKDEDVAATYAFSGWMDGDGVRVDLSCVNADVALYPYFEATPKSYTVTFDVGGEIYCLNYLYGSLPSLDLSPEMPDDEYYTYTFAGWDKPLDKVVGDVTYRALFNKEYILPLFTGGAEIRYEDDTLVATARDPFTRSFDLSRVLRLSTERAMGVRLVSHYMDVSIGYNTAIQMLNSGNTTLDIGCIASGEYAYYYTATVGDGKTPFKLSVSVPLSLSGGRQLRLYTVSEDGERAPIFYTAEEGRLSFTAESGVRYTLAEEYELDVIQAAHGTLSVPSNIVRRGDRVAVSLDLPLGVSLDRLFIVYPDGAESDIVGCEFIMPDSDITVCAVTSLIEYEITFMSADKTVVKYKLHYGDTVPAPTAPSRPSDSEYRYYFVGWSEPIGVVTEDKVYVALYEMVPVPKRDEPDGLQISDEILGLLVAAYVALGMLVLVVIPSVIITVLLVRRERKRYPRNQN